MKLVSATFLLLLFFTGEKVGYAVNLGYEAIFLLIFSVLIYFKFRDYLASSLSSIIPMYTMSLFAIYGLLRGGAANSLVIPGFIMLLVISYYTIQHIIPVHRVACQRIFLIAFLSSFILRVWLPSFDFSTPGRDVITVGESAMQRLNYLSYESNAFSSMLNMFIVALLLGFGRVKGALLYAIILLLSIAVVFTFSRSGYISLLLIYVVVILRNSNPRLLIVPFIVIGSLALLKADVLYTFFNRLGAVSVLDGARGELWFSLVDLFLADLAYFFFGTGARHLVLDNTYLSFFAAYGFFGGIFLTLVVLYFLSSKFLWGWQSLLLSLPILLLSLTADIFGQTKVIILYFTFMIWWKSESLLRPPHFEKRFGWSPIP